MPSMRKKKTPTTISDLPNCFIIEIIARLPLETVMACKCVSKIWYDILSDPIFAKLHLDRAPKTSVIAFVNVRVPGGDKKTYLYDPQDPHPEHHFRQATFPDPRFHRSVIFGSCNGLILFGLRSEPELYVYNPIVRKQIKLPVAKFGEEGGLVCGFYGIGYSRVSDKYKVIKITKCMKNGSKEAEICEIGGGGGRMWWRTIEDSPPGDYWWSREGVLINGALYWFVTQSSDYLNHVGYICCFDFETEKFSLLPPPPPLERFHFKDIALWKTAVGPWCLHRSGVYISLLKGVFSVRCFDGNYLTWWVMRDHRLKEPWTKESAIHKSRIRSSLENFTRYFLKQGNVEELRYEPSFISPEDL